MLQHSLVLCFYYNILEGLHAVVGLLRYIFLHIVARCYIALHGVEPTQPTTLRCTILHYVA